MGKTTRFGDLVRESGRPEVVTLWSDPKKDRAFSKVIKENRVLTVLSDPGSHRKEYGRIGFQQQEGALYLVFPRSLPMVSDSRVVGINYQLTEDRPPKDPVTKELREELEPPAGKGGSKQRPKLKTFEVTVRRIATLEEKRRIKADTEEAAKEAALEALKRKRFAIGRAEVRDEIRKVNESSQG